MRRLPFWPVLLGAVLLCLGSILFAALIGERTLSVSAAWQELLRPSQSPIVWGVRLPRIIAAAFVGAALAVSGVGLQGLTGNSLADPYLVGVASGASVGVGLGVLLGIADTPGQPLLSLLALTCALLATLLVFALARSGRQLSLSGFLLAGIVVGAFLAAVVNLLLTLARQDQSRILQKLMGYLDDAGWQQLVVLAPVTLIGVVVLSLCGKGLDAMAFGEATARSVGVDVERFKLGVLALIALLTACAVAVSGVIGFVGLVVPHLARALLGPPHKPLIPVAALLGAALLVLADQLSRSALPGTLLPIGVITAILGAPFFAFLLRRQLAD
ncbi:MAG: iron ABC transporter permease [Armatimonadetes bacterium]|nr:iron ABC transporter permease [Armatimonadota bacterium]